MARRSDYLFLAGGGSTVVSGFLSVWRGVVTACFCCCQRCHNDKPKWHISRRFLPPQGNLRPPRQISRYKLLSSQGWWAQTTRTRRSFRLCRRSIIAGAPLLLPHHNHNCRTCRLPQHNLNHRTFPPSSSTFTVHRIPPSFRFSSPNLVSMRFNSLPISLKNQYLPFQASERVSE